MSEAPRLLRPTPRRPFELPSNESSQPPSPPSGEVQGNNNGADFLDVKNDFAAKRTGSLLNLTSSTLLGIFQPTAFESGRDENSPWDTQLHTPTSEPANMNLPSRLSSNSASPGTRRSAGVKQPRRIANAYYASLVAKTSLLFVCGVAYGTIMAHLHENNWITPVKLELIDRNSYRYLGSWGFGGVSLAFVLPWLDNLWENAKSHPGRSQLANGYGEAAQRSNNDTRSSRWTLAVRSIGAFVGIGFAMRRLPWESTTQESLTLALVNPFLWYLIDRTKTGFWLSTVVALTGMGITLFLHPQIIPSSTGWGLRNWRFENGVAGGLSQDAMAVAIWLASVFFSACVCFGNIGRQLALGENTIQEANFSARKR